MQNITDTICLLDCSYWGDNVTTLCMNITTATSDPATNEAATITYIQETVSNWLWRTVPLILLCIGLIGNALTVRVLTRLGTARQPTLTFLLFLAITDTVVLLTGLPRYWISYTFDYDILLISNAGCKFYYFFIYSSMQFSSWILVGVSVERVVKTYFPFRYKRLYTTKRVKIGLVITLFVLILVNIHFFFTNGINDYTEGECSSLTPETYWFDEYVFVYIDLTVLSLVPFVIMLISNIFLIRVLRRVQRERSDMMHEKYVKNANRFSIRMTKMLLVCTMYFLVATAPISIYFVVDSYFLPRFEESGDEASVARMDLAWSTTYLFSFSNYCVNFYLYTAMNDRFSRELRAVLCCKPSGRRWSSVYSVRGESSYRGQFSSHGLDLQTEESETNETVISDTIHSHPVAGSSEEGVIKCC
ncbi:GALR2-like protein [Mya arenaria]|uniref:GALR2-like protein n=1 Tax=Mya arenaria TaxID=6604 RepID=A0ABY7DNI1_MYAAR|nr:neuromedin-U receptor 2-like [Mya arenaria]WAQ98250.1 GALR2-like protein [Mya arenaria]